MVEKKIKVNNPTGFHARPASELCALAMEFDSDIEIIVGDKTLDAKSIMNILAASIGGGSIMTLRCNGADEQTAIQAMSRFISEFRES